MAPDPCTHKPHWLRDHPARWRAGTLDVDALHAASDGVALGAGHPERTRRLAFEMLSLFDSSAVMREVFHDVSAYMLMMGAVTLHHRPASVGARRPEAGCTFTALCELLDREDPQFRKPGHRYAGRSQLHAQLVRMQQTGLLHMAPDPGQPGGADRRRRRLAPTTQLDTILQDWLRAFLRCALAAGPELGLAPAHAFAVDAPRWHGDQRPSVAWVRETLSYRIAGWVHDRFGLSSRFALLQRLMVRRHGYNAFLSLMEQLEVLPGGAGRSAMSISRLAERFEVSRDTVRNVLGAMAAEGHFSYDPASGVALMGPEFTRTAQRWMAIELVWMCGMAECARQTLPRDAWTAAPPAPAR